MKKNQLQPIVVLLILLVSVCGCKNFTSEAIKDALANEENCLKACDEKADKALADYEKWKEKVKEDQAFDNKLEELVDQGNSSEIKRMRDKIDSENLSIIGKIYRLAYPIDPHIEPYIVSREKFLKDDSSFIIDAVRKEGIEIIA